MPDDIDSEKKEGISILGQRISYPKEKHELLGLITIVSGICLFRLPT
jgi:hypothetical protein